MQNKNLSDNNIQESILEKSDRSLFDQIAEKYYRKDLTPSSRLARQHRLAQTIGVIPTFTDAAVLEVGCGAGFTARYLKKYYASYTGIDYSDNLIGYAGQYNMTGNAEFQAVSLKEYKPKRKFDIVLMIGVLHHMENAEQGLAQVIDLLKPGGWVLVNEPQSSNLLIQLLRIIRTRTDAAYSEDQHNFSPSELEQLFDKAGLQNIILKPQGFFSTPFAEVIIQPQFIARPLAQLMVLLDKSLESCCSPLLKPLSWNIIAAGQLPNNDSTRP